jgi:hypothetical protein
MPRLPASHCGRGKPLPNSLLTCPRSYANPLSLDSASARSRARAASAKPR